MTVDTLTATPVASGIHFGEGPRWRASEGLLYFSDFFGWRINTYDPTSHKISTLVQLPHGHRPSGLGWLPDGRLLFVSMVDRKLMRVDKTGSEPVVHADLERVATYHCNDMCVDSKGRAYVGNFGYNNDEYTSKLIPMAGGDQAKLAQMIQSEEPLKRTRAKLALAHPDGKVEVAADGLDFPNGTVITPDGKTLIIAETFGFRLTAFDIDVESGHLSNRRVWAPLQYLPDGIALDEGGGIWVANPLGTALMRYVEGGAVTHTVVTSQPSFAVMLVGQDRKTLVAVTAPDSNEAVREAKAEGKLEECMVEHAGVGWP